MEKSALRALGVVAMGLVSLLVVGANRHIALGVPYERETLWLAIVFACSGAIVGLLTLAVVLSPGHWSTRVSCCLIAGSLIAGGWTLFAQWNAFFIWQMMLKGFSETALVELVAAIARLRGYVLNWGGPGAATQKASQMTLSNLLLLTAASALLASVVSLSRPVGLWWAAIAVLSAAGASAGLTVLIGFWAVVSKWPIWLRCVVALLIAPNGGLVYSICTRFMGLLLSAPWFSLVTTLMLALVVASAGYVRWHGVTLDSPTRDAA